MLRSVQVAFVAALFCWPFTHVATAQLTQPNGQPIPTPRSQVRCNDSQDGPGNSLLTMFACVCEEPNVCNIGRGCPGGSVCDQGMNGTCESRVWHNENDNPCAATNIAGIDPWQDASLEPQTFRPTCALTFRVIERRADFQNVFGWYNVTDQSPGIGDLHVMLDCNDGIGSESVLDLRGDPRYLGGEIGFFIATPQQRDGNRCAGSDCCATLSRIENGVGYVYFSERTYNEDGGPNPVIHLLVYDSILSPDRFYFAWEDLFGAPSTDFNDFVTSVDGVACAGGGLPCDTGEEGICAAGVTVCESGTVSCQGVADAQPESCNGLDDDCDGVIDDGADCDQGFICQRGECIQRCAGDLEFSCLGDVPSVCDAESGLCVETACLGVVCPEDRSCRSGSCVAKCEGIVCPVGAVCSAGACVDPCRDVSCAPGEVCQLGVCFGGCGGCAGLTCAAGLACSESGACAEPACAKVRCEDSKVCKAGACIDPCDGAICPHGQSCRKGACTAVTSEGGGSDEDGGLEESTSPIGVGDDPDGGPVGVEVGNNGGCACAVGGEPSLGQGLLSAFAIFLALGWGRRRKAE